MHFFSITLAVQRRTNFLPFSLRENLFYGNRQSGEQISWEYAICGIVAGNQFVIQNSPTDDKCRRVGFLLLKVIEIFSKTEENSQIIFSGGVSPRTPLEPLQLKQSSMIDRSARFYRQSEDFCVIRVRAMLSKVQ